MKTTDIFKQQIKAYLDQRATEDSLFAVVYQKENKSIDECCNYILSQVQNSGCNGFADNEIFGMAVHYYDEDDIKDVKPINARVVVNHAIELTEEDKAAAKQKAINNFAAAEKVKLEAAAKKAEEARKKRLQEKREKQEVLQPSLF